MQEPHGAGRHGEPASAPRYRGWRVSLNRLIWRAHIFTASSLIVWLERVRVEMRGLDKLDAAQAYVFTPDHRSHVDITALMAALQTARYATKRELFDEPVLGAAMRALGMIPIDRDNPAIAKRTLDEVAAKLGRTVSVLIFPEGTRAPAGQMIPYFATRRSERP